MFAVIVSGGKQYKVAKDGIIVVEKIAADVGAQVKLDHVLMIGGTPEIFSVGTPVLSGVEVVAEVLSQFRGDKVIVFKKRRRKNSRRKNGHRQDLTKLKILSINKG